MKLPVGEAARASGKAVWMRLDSGDLAAQAAQVVDGAGILAALGEQARGVADGGDAGGGAGGGGGGVGGGGGGGEQRRKRGGDGGGGRARQ